MTISPTSSRKPEDPIYPKTYPPTSIHSLSNPDNINQHQYQRGNSLQNWALPLPASKIVRDEKNVSLSLASLPVDVSSDFVNNCTIGFPFVELHPAAISSSASGSNLFSRAHAQIPPVTSTTISAVPATLPHPQQAHLSIAETPAVSLGDGFLESVIAGASSGNASRLSVAHPQNPLNFTKPFDRTNPPSSPLSSGSGNIVQSKARTAPVYGPLAKREPGVYHMTYPQHGLPSPPNIPLQQQYAPHNNDNSNPSFIPHQTHANYHDGNAPYLTSMSQNPPSISPIDNNAIYGVDRTNIPPIHNIGSTGTGSSSDHFQQMQIYHEQQQQHEQQQSKLTQELFQRRQAERAARNRESSRRAREKAKHRFRTLEMDNFNLRETVRTLRMQNEYLHAQFERLASIQQACHICRYKTVAIPPPPPPRAQSSPPPPGAPNMHQ